MILPYTLISPMSQHQTQQLKISQITSRIEYITQTHSILVLILHSTLMRNVAALAVFKYDLMTIFDSCSLTWGHPVCKSIYHARLASSHINGFIRNTVTRRRLRSASSSSLVVRRSAASVPSGNRAFPVAAYTRLRNSLPQNVTSAPSLRGLHTVQPIRLKTQSLHLLLLLAAVLLAK